MSETIQLPNLGFDMTEGTFVNWVKNVGDLVNQGDVIAEVEADKATIEVESSATGTLMATLVNPGDVVAVGAPIATIGAAGEGAIPGSSGNGVVAPATAPTESASAQSAAPVVPPSPESSVAAPSTAPADNAGNQKPNTPELSGTPVSAPAIPVSANGANVNGASNGAINASVGDDYPDGVKASPLARNIAKDKGIDLKLVHGTGPEGRITKSDVESYTPSAAPAVAQPSNQASTQGNTQAGAEPVATGAIKTATQQDAPVANQPAQATAAPALTVQPERPSAQNSVPLAPVKVPAGMTYEEIPLTRMRQRIAARTVESKQQIPHFYLTIELDMGAALNLRKQINEGLPDADKVTVNDLVVKAIALTLRKFPNLNSHYYGDKLIRYKNINVGIAVALEGGLINVVAKDADSMSISRMAARNKDMIEAAKSGKVAPEYIEGGTFTVSNLGMYGIEQFQAIINPPEAGILAVGASKETVIVEKGETRIATRMKVTLSVDHRVSDGAEGAQFLVYFKALMENPMRLLV